MAMPSVAQAQDSGGDQTGLLRLQGAVGSSNTTSRAAPSISARAICTSLRSAGAQVAHQPFGVDRQLPVLLEKLRRGGLHPSVIQRPQRVRYSPAQKHRFRDGKVRDQVQLPGG